VGIAGSNDPELAEPAPLDTELTIRQVRDVVWLALDRDISPKNLLNIVNKDSWVVIKPNIVTIPLVQDISDNRYKNWNLVPDLDEDVEHWGLVTDLRVIKAVIEYLIERIGPRRITVAEGGPWYTSGGKLKKEKFVDGWHCKWEGFGNLSYASIVNELNNMQTGTMVDIIDLNEDEPVYVNDYDPYKTGIGAFQYVDASDPDGTSETESTRRRGIYIPKTVLERDVLITVPVLKTHSSAGVTLCMKNFVGCVHSQVYGNGNMKLPIHKGGQYNLARGIADLASIINPDYAVTEGFWATMQMHTGQNGININHNIAIAGGDVVATEAVSMMAMGFNPLDSDMLRMCHMKKLGQWHPDKIQIAGPPVKSLKRNYARAANHYCARGVRKWLMLGPVRKTIDKPSELDPKLGENSSGEEWKLLDGDKIIDAGIHLTGYYRFQDSLRYAIPGSNDARKNSLFYLALRINAQRKQIVGQLLIGLKGADFRAFLNGSERGYNKEPLVYDPTPTNFIKFRQGENILVLEIKKMNKKKEDIELAANICDLDGDRLEGITFDPKGE